MVWKEERGGGPWEVGVGRNLGIRGHQEVCGLVPSGNEDMEAETTGGYGQRNRTEAGWLGVLPEAGCG